jgi:MFS family permease
LVNKISVTGITISITLIMGTSTFLGYAFGVLGPDLIREFSLTRSQLGLATTVSFVVGGFGSVLAGRFVDKIGVRKITIYAMLIVALSLFLIAVTTNYLMILGLSAFAGIALAFGNPITNKVIAQEIPNKIRGPITGIKQSGVQLGASAAGFALAPLVVLFGWRIGLAITVLIPLFALLLSLKFIPNREVEIEVKKTEIKLPKPVYLIAIYGFFNGAAISCLTAYLPLYLVESLDFTLAQAGVLFGTFGLVALIARVFWGWVAGRVDIGRELLIAMAIFAAVGIALISYGYASSVWIIWFATLLLGITAMSWNSVGMLMVINGVPKAATGQATGVVLFGFYVGIASSPVLFGYLVDRFESYEVAWGFVASLFLLSTISLLKKFEIKNSVEG